MSMIDFDSFEAPKSNGGKIIFVRAKNCPVVMKPIGGLLPYDAVYDEAAKHNRKPRKSDPKNKVNHRYLVNGLTAEGEVKVFDIGTTTVLEVKRVRETAKGFGQSPDCFMTISTTGSGIKTTYQATPARVDAKLATMQVAPEQLHDLDAILAQIVHDDAQSSDAEAFGEAA